MSDDDHEQRRQAFAEAAAKSCELLAQPVEPRAADPLREDVLTQWRRGMPKPPAPKPPPPPPSAEINQLRAQDWTRFVDGRVEAALAERDVIQRAIRVAIIAELQRRHRIEIAKLDLRLSALLAEVDLLRRGLADDQDHAAGGADVIELRRSGAG